MFTIRCVIKNNIYFFKKGPTPPLVPPLARKTYFLAKKRGASIRLWANCDIWNIFYLFFLIFVSNYRLCRSQNFIFGSILKCISLFFFFSKAPKHQNQKSAPHKAYNLFLWKQRKRNYVFSLLTLLRTISMSSTFYAVIDKGHIQVWMPAFTWETMGDNS